MDEDRTTRERIELRAPDLARIALRSMLLQSVWNPRGMQHVGFCFSMLPLLRRLKLDGEQRRAFLRRHLRFFNTNPTLATYVLGAAAAAEARGSVEGEPGPNQIKSGLSGPLGMAGDSLMWSSVRPLAAFVGLALALVGRPLAGVVSLLVIYNGFHLALKWRGIAAGASRGVAAVDELLGEGFRRLVSSVRGAGAFAAGFVLALAIGGSQVAAPTALAFGGAFFVLGVVAHTVRMPATLIGLGGAIGGLVFMFLR